MGQFARTASNFQDAQRAFSRSHSRGIENELTHHVEIDLVVHVRRHVREVFGQ